MQISSVCFSSLSLILPCLRKHTLGCNEKKKPPVPRSRDRRLFKSPLSDLQGARTRPRLNLRPLSCRMSLTPAFVFKQVPGWSLNRIYLACSGDVCSRRGGGCSVPGVIFFPAKRLCLGISRGRKCVCFLWLHYHTTYPFCFNCFVIAHAGMAPAADEGRRFLCLFKCIVTYQSHLACNLLNRSSTEAARRFSFLPFFITRLIKADLLRFMCVYSHCLCPVRL